MLPFVDFVALPAALVGLIGLLILNTRVKKIPQGPRFICSRHRPPVGRIKLALWGFSSLWVLGLGLWLGGRMTASPVGHFFGMIILIATAVVCCVHAIILHRRLNAGPATLDVELGEEPTVIFSHGDETRRLPLTSGAVRAWTVGNGMSGPQFIQLAMGTDPASGLALFVVPGLRHFELAEGASWLNTYDGWSPIARGGDLLDLLAPFTVPANADWKPSV